MTRSSATRATWCCGRSADPGQQALKRARVLIVGAGGLGAPAALYLAAAGVGHVTLADPDIVSLSNLQRQVLYGVADIGALKVDVARRRLRRDQSGGRGGGRA